MSPPTATETSPLLPKSTTTTTIPEAASAGTVPDSISGSHDDTLREPSDDTLTRHTSAADRERQYTGLPELRKRMIYMFPALGIGVFLAAVDQTIIFASYGKIGSDLGALQKTGWIATGYFLTLTSFQPLYGKLSDIFTRKSCLLFAYLVFGLGTLFCGLAQNIDQLIAARMFAGIGGGGMTTVVSIVLSDAIPLKERGTWQGYVNIIYATGAGLGAPLGGVFSDGIGWRWSFLLQAPICLIAFLAVALVMKNPPPTPRPKVGDADYDGTAADPTEENWQTNFKRIDFLGSAILIVAVFALIFGFDRGSNVSWRSVECLVPLCLSIPLFGVFVFVEVRVAKEPLAPGRIIFDRSLVACYLCNFFAVGGWYASLFSVPLFYQAVNGYSSAKSGLLLLPSVIASVSGSLFAGFYMQRFGVYYWLTVVCYSTAVFGVFLILLFTGVLQASDVGISAGLMTAGFSSGIGVTTTLIGLISNAYRDDQAIATACSYLFRSLGSTICVSLSTTVANQVLRAVLRQTLKSGKDADEIIDAVRRDLGNIGSLRPDVQNIVRESYATSTQASLGLQMVLIFGAAVSAWFIREKPLSG